MKIKSTHKKYSKVIVIVGAVILLVAVAFLILRLAGTKAPAPTSQTPPSTKSGPSIPGPTAAELQASADQKQNNITEAQQQAQSTSPSGTQKQVSVLIVDASQYGSNVEIRAYTPNVVETDGICSVTLTQAGKSSVFGSSKGLQNAQTTQCSTISIPVSSFSNKGTWVAVVTYSSASSIGSSQPTNVTIN